MSASDPYELLISLGLAVAQIYRPNPCQEQACAELLATLDGSSLASDVVRPAIDDALRQAEDSMKRTAALMQKMRALRNRSVTINRLPSELLADIFWRISSPTVIARLISLTHVCTHWRAVALDDARLWATVWIECDPESDTLQTSCVPRMTEYLRRSRSHPLFVNIGHLPQSSMLACIETLQAHLHRIQTFWLQTETVDQMLHCLTRLRTAAVRLEDLRLEVDPFESDDSDSEASSVSPFQSHACDLFGGHTPLLRSLYLSEVSNLSIPTTLRNLRHFTLVRQTMPITHMDAFLDVLENCPGLETLSMSSFSTFLSSPQPPAHLDRAITLPALLSLTLEWQQPMFVGHLLKHLRLPGPTKIDITYGLDTDQNIWNARLSADDKLLPPAGHDSIHTLSSAHTLRVTGKRMGSSFSWYTGLDAVPTNNGHIRSEPALTIQLCGRRSSECLVAHFARTHRGRPPFSLVHTLAVGGRKIGISSQADWAGLFSAMPQLRTLHLAVYPAHVLVCLRALCPLPVEEDGTEEDDALGNAGPLLPCPGLHDLKILSGSKFAKEMKARLEKTVQRLSVDGGLKRLVLLADQRSEVNEEVLGQFCTVEFV